ncbi:MAG: hypothetical protein IKO05_10330 [Selenomonadaceae bacterium]|nr:hypothetical protein [Selenomonadaceae bacterium]
MIHVCFGLHDADGHYSKFVGTTMASIFENTSAPVTIHILHDPTLTADNRDKFSYLAGCYGQRVNFHNVAALCPNEINLLREKLLDKINMRFSIGAFYRLLMKKIFGGGKMIYLDADTIVNLDIMELWRQDLGNFTVAAVPEVEATFNNMVSNKFVLNTGRVRKENYFCSGVMIFDLDKLDEKFFYDGVQFLSDNPACESPDQDILNAAFSENYFRLEQKFDSFSDAERLRRAPVAKKIYHYAGRCIGLNSYDVYNKLWLENFSKTPWSNAEVFHNMGREIDNTIDQRIELTQWLMKVYAGRRRAFCIEPNGINFVKALFAVREDEKFIEMVDDTSLKKLLSKMKSQHGKTMFFIFVPFYPPFKDELVRNGFKEFEDFVNGFLFVTQKQYQQPRLEYNFIQAL